MGRTMKVWLIVAMIAATTVAGSSPGAAKQGARTPRWVRHVRQYPGGISNGVRAYLSPKVAKAQAQYADQARATIRQAGDSSEGSRLRNVQMNTDSTPPLPQDETSVAFNVFDPRIAVAAANDYVEGGLWIGHTHNGGRTWESWFQAPTLPSTRDKCTGSDPSVVYSARDAAFYVSTLCFMRAHAESEVHVWKSIDDGETWTPGRLASVVVSNFDDSIGDFDGSVFYDKELMAVDNNPSSPFYGRIYVTYIKFHLQPDGFSDFCPAKLSYTDDIPTGDPTATVWTGPIDIGADNPGGDGTGESANQWATPVIDDKGGVNVAYAIEECNTTLDPELKFKRSTDGGASFPADAVTITNPTQFEDNPDPTDLLAPKIARAPISPSLAYSPVSGALEYVYQNTINREETGADISFQQSFDFGQTWSDARFISITEDGGPAPQDQFFPWISVDESGRLHAIWFDNRNDPANLLIETFQAVSLDDGATWTNFNISEVSWDPNLAFFASGAFIGDYNAIAASDSAIYPVWTDGRDNPGPPLGETDIWMNVERRHPR